MVAANCSKFVRSSLLILYRSAQNKNCGDGIGKLILDAVGLDLRDAGQIVLLFMESAVAGQPDQPEADGQHETADDTGSNPSPVFVELEIAHIRSFRELLAKRD